MEADNDKDVTGLAKQLYKVCESAGHSEVYTALFICAATLFSDRTVPCGPAPYRGCFPFLLSFHPHLPFTSNLGMLFFDLVWSLSSGDRRPIYIN